MRSLISIHFPVLKVEPERAQMWYQLSPFTVANVAIAEPFRTIQATFTNPLLPRATPLLRPMFSFQHPMQLTQYPNDDGVRKPSKLRFPTSFPKKILTPSGFKLILWTNSGIDYKNHSSCSFRIENFGRSLEGQGGPTRAAKYPIPSNHMEAGHQHENPNTPQQQETHQAIS